LKTSDIDILIVPGWTNSGPDHWQSRWQRKLATARRVEQADWEQPMIGDWPAHHRGGGGSKPAAVIVAHSCGVSTAVHAAHKLPPEWWRAFLVAAPDLDGSELWPARHGGFAPVPLSRLPFPRRWWRPPTIYCSLPRAGSSPPPGAQR
jgi:predicted alpha/beta hydrolase family esterase